MYAYNELELRWMLTIRNHQVQSNLPNLYTPKSDTIIDMDWMTKNFIHIDCTKCHVLLSREIFPFITLTDAWIIEYNIELTVVDQIPLAKKKDGTL